MQHFHAEFSCSDLKHNCITHTAATDQMAAHVPQAVQAMKDMVDFGLLWRCEVVPIRMDFMSQHILFNSIRCQH